MSGGCRREVADVGAVRGRERADRVQVSRAGRADAGHRALHRIAMVPDGQILYRDTRLSSASQESPCHRPIPRAHQRRNHMFLTMHIGDGLEYSIVASGSLRFICPVPSETAKHVPWHSGLHRTQKPAEMDHIWTKLIHAHTVERPQRLPGQGAARHGPRCRTHRSAHLHLVARDKMSHAVTRRSAPARDVRSFPLR